MGHWNFNAMAMVAMVVALHLYAMKPNEAVPTNKTALRLVRQINEQGWRLGIMMGGQSELDPLLHPSIFKPHALIPSIDLSGRRFHIGSISAHNVVAVRSGEAMLNAGMTSQLLLDFFKISGIVHYGTAGCINSSLSIGFVSIPKYLAHTGVWIWKRYGEGPGFSHGFQGINNIGNLHFGDYNVPMGNGTNLLSNVEILPEEVYSVTGLPEVAQNVFWITVNEHFFNIAAGLEGFQLESCINTSTCLPVNPKVVVGLRAASASIFVDNAAYRDFLYNKFGVSSVDEESTAIALACMANDLPFISIRGLSDLAGGSAGHNEYNTFSSLATINAVRALQEFIRLLYSPQEAM